MRTLLVLMTCLLSAVNMAQITTNPSPPEATGPVTIFFDKAGTGLAAYNGTIYAHMGVTVNGTVWQNVIGNWGNNTAQPALSLVSGTTYSLTISPDLFTYFGVSAGNAITQICVVFRSATGTQQTIDYFINVGAFQATLNAPALNSSTIVNVGGSLNISASNTNGNANYTLLANGVSIATSTGSTFSFTDTNITENKNYDLQIAQGNITFSRKFSVLVNPGTLTASLPTGLEDGINYSSDATKATLVLDAPGKDFVYVAGSFNNYLPNSAYAMRKDPGTGKFWLELTGLTPGQQYTYQYWVVDQTPFTNSPALVKTADPYSTLVLSQFDDPWIPASSYPNIPPFPVGQEREVTVLQTAQPTYNWQVTNFVKPKKEDLVIYEVLIRDFDSDRNYQDLIDKIQYFKDTKINAIHLMPVMEFEGNESWGYNTSFHMALDKYYGTSDKLKEFIDLCHQNGIAVILDLVLNHAFGRNPMVRMWMKDPDGDGWGDPSAENPYFNEFARHSYNVGMDFNHQQSRTQYYTRRVIKHWIQEYKIDGFRWDLTKGFTQNCTGNDDACTNSYQQDRVDVLRQYADYSWSLDPTHFVIFEHLGQDNEEQQWANYRINETPSKGVMMWGEMTAQYAQLAMGYANDADISRVGHLSRGFQAKRLIGYAESHDKERIMYSALAFGNPGGQTPLNNIANALPRMASVAATSILVPGPRMIWHFAELGMNVSLFTCPNGTVNTDFDVVAGDCKLDTKPQPQWGWLSDPARMQVFNDHAKIIGMKINEPVFEGNYAISPDGSNIRQRIYIWDDALPASTLKNVVVLANFSVATQNINPSFPYTGTWYNLIDGTTLNVTSTTSPVSIPAGQFRIYGNQPPSLRTPEIEANAVVSVYPNPTNGSFAINMPTKNVEVYSVSGQLLRNFAGSSAEDYSFDISDLPNGLYMVKATDTEGRSKTMKLLKQ